MRQTPDVIESSGVSTVAMLTPRSESHTGRILCYHEVNETDPASRFAVTRQQFEIHVDYIANANETAAELGRQPRLVVTFDDNLRSHTRISTPVLRDAGVSGLFFLNPGLLGPREELSMSDVTSMIEAGMTIGVHNVTHTVAAEMTIVDFGEAAKRCAEFCDSLEQPRRWAYPGGFLGSYTEAQDDILEDLGFERYSTLEGDPDHDLRRVQPRYVVRRYTQVRHLRAIDQGKMRSIGMAKQLRHRLRGGS